MFDIRISFLKFSVNNFKCKLSLFSQQPARFSNRCLQTIGRCWPHLRALGVGGAGCGIQGLASLGEREYLSVAFFFFFVKLILLMSKDTLNWLKV